MENCPTIISTKTSYHWTRPFIADPAPISWSSPTDTPGNCSAGVCWNIFNRFEVLAHQWARTRGFYIFHNASPVGSGSWRLHNTYLEDIRSYLVFTVSHFFLGTGFPTWKSCVLLRDVVSRTQPPPNELPFQQCVLHLCHVFRHLHFLLFPNPTNAPVLWSPPPLKIAPLLLCTPLAWQCPFLSALTPPPPLIPCPTMTIFLLHPQPPSSLSLSFNHLSPSSLSRALFLSLFILKLLRHLTS